MTALTELFTGPMTIKDPVIAFPHAGGSARFFHLWKDHWTGGPVWGVTYPGRDSRLADPPPADIQALAAECGREVVSAVAAGRIRHRVRLFGHSMGALVAYETSQWLISHTMLWNPTGRLSIQLIVSGHNSPEITFPPGYRMLHNQSDEQLIAELTRVDSRNEEIFSIPELAQLLLPYTRDDYRLTETYRMSPSPQRIDDVMVLCGITDPDCWREGLAGWERYATQWRGVTTFPGGHFYLSEHPQTVPQHLSSE